MSPDATPVSPLNDPALQHASSPVPAAPLFFWRCAVCGRRDTFGAAELRTFANGGWPICCGQVVLGYPVTIESK